MAGITEELRLEIAGFLANLQTASGAAVAAVTRINAAGASSGAGFARAGQEAARAGGAITAAGGRVAQFQATVRRTAAAAAGIAAVTAAAVLLARRFPQIGQAAALAWSRVKAGAAAAASSAGPVAMSLARITIRAAQVAAAVHTITAAYRFLRGGAEAAAASMAKANAAGKGGAAGGRGGSTLLAGAVGGAIGGPIGGLIASGISSAAGEIKSALGAPLAAAASQETLKVRLGVIVGDEGKTQALLDDLEKRAANTPLQFGELAEGATMLMAFGEGADQVGDTLQRIGDISAGVGAPLNEIAEIYGKARVQNQLFAEDINQLTGRGIPVIGEFAKQLGVSEAEVKKLASEGKVTFPMLEQAFQSLTGEGGRFSGMLSEQANTMTGKLSTLGDAIKSNWKAFGAPVNDALKPLLDLAIERIQGLKDRAAEIGATVASGVRQIVAVIQLLASMPMAEIGKLLGAALRVGIVNAVNLLYRGFIATVAAAGQLLHEYGRAAVQIFSVLSKGEFWSTMGTVLLGLAQTFISAILSGMAQVVKGMKDGLGETVGNKVFGDSDTWLSEQADAFKADAGANLSQKGVDLEPLLKGVGAGLVGAIGRTAGAFKDKFDSTEGILQAPEGAMDTLSDFVARAKEAMENAKNATPKDGAGGGGAGGDAAAATQGMRGVPVMAGRLAGAINTLTGKSAGETLQEKGNSLLQKIADNTSKNTKPQPKVVSPGARAVGVFT